jgi:predicted DNA-binding transcriptional regulator AlpA
VPQDAPVRFLAFADLEERGVPFSRQHLSRLEAAGEFPARVQLGKATVRWVESEVDAWARSLPRGPIDVAGRKPAKGAP